MIKEAKQIHIIIVILLVVSLTKINIDGLLFLSQRYYSWILLLGLIAIFLLFSQKKTIQITTIDLIILALTAIFTINFYTSDYISIYHINFWYYIGYIYAYIMFRQIYLSIQNSKIIETILTIIVLIATENAVYSLFQFFEQSSFNGRRLNITGIFPSPNQLGLLLSLGVFSCIVLLKNYKHTQTLTYINYLICLLISGALMLTQSRGAILALSMGITSLFFNVQYLKNIYKKTPKPLFICACTGVLILLIYVGLKAYDYNPNSMYGRYFILKISLSEIIKNPWGHGLNSFTTEYNTAKANYFETPRTWKEIKNADFVFRPFNDFLQLIFELGILWFAFFCYFFYAIFKLKASKSSLKTSKAFLIILVIFACTNTILPFPFFILIGILFLCVLIETSTKTIIQFPNQLIIRIIIGIPLFSLLIIIPTRIDAERHLKQLNKSSKKDSIDFSTLYKYTNRIDNDKKHYSYIAKLLKRNGFENEATKYLDSAFVKCAMPSVGKILAYDYIKTGNIKKAIEIFKYNIHSEPYRYEPKVDLLKLYSDFNDIKNAIKIANEIMDLPVKIPSLKVQEIKLSTQKKIDVFKKITLDTSLNGRLSGVLKLKSKVLNKTIPYRIYQPPLEKIKKKTGTLYLNDGFVYMREGEIIKKVDSLIQNNVIHPVTLIFLEPKDLNLPYEKRWNIRQELYFCNNKYNDFLTKELFPYVETKYPLISDRRSIIGVSFGGLSAAYIAIKNPNLFENVLLQSPAFHPRKEIYDLYKSKPEQGFNMYISYGTGKDTEKQDLPFIDILEKKGYDLHIEKIIGGNHSWDVWEKQLNDILIRYYGVQ